MDGAGGQAEGQAGRYLALKDLRRLVPGTDVELFSARSITIRTPRRRPRVAFDGEKRRMLAPLTFDIHDDALSIIVPDEQDRVVT